MGKKGMALLCFESFDGRWFHKRVGHQKGPKTPKGFGQQG